MGTGSFHHCFAQSVGVGTNTPHTSAILDVQSTTKGAALPAMTTAQRRAIASPKVGLLVFDTDKNTLFMYDGAQWQVILFSSTETSIPPVERSPIDAEAGDFLGSSVSISGDYAVIGSPSNGPGGAAYVFFRNGPVWAQQAKLVASDGAASDNFGTSVSISGNYIIIGAWGDDALFVDQGSAYIFTRSGTTWTEQAHLFATTPGLNDRFGSSVAISGDYAVVGAPLDDVNGNATQGSAYFFVRSGSAWTMQDHVIGPLGASDDRFGTSVSIHLDYAIISAPFDDVGGNSNQGSAHVFTRVGTDWTHHRSLSAMNGSASDHFGQSVSIYGDWAAVAAPNYGPVNFSGQGAVYLFLRTGVNWSSGTFVVLTNFGVPNTVEDRFGNSVCITADHLLVGATGVDITPYSSVGSCYLFRRNNNGWGYVRTITDANYGASQQAGASVGIDGFNCVIGASGSLNTKGKILFLNVE